jgi:hypothetical protein
MFGAKLTGKAERAKGEREPLAAILVSCSLEAAKFSAWLDANPFGAASFGDVFVSAYGMADVRVTGK